MNCTSLDEPLDVHFIVAMVLGGLLEARDALFVLCASVAKDPSVLKMLWRTNPKYHARRKSVRSNSWGSKPDTDTDT